MQRSPAALEVFVAGVLRCVCSVSFPTVVCSNRLDLRA